MHLWSPELLPQVPQVGFLTPTCRLKLLGANLNGSGAKTSPNKILLNSANRLSCAIPWTPGTNPTVTENVSVTMLMIQRNCGRFYALYYTMFLERYSPFYVSQTGLANCFVTFFSDKISKIRDSFSDTEYFTLPFSPDVPKFYLFKSVSVEKVWKVITKSPKVLPAKSMAYFSSEGVLGYSLALNC